MQVLVAWLQSHCSEAAGAAERATLPSMSVTSEEQRPEALHNGERFEPENECGLSPSILTDAAKSL